MIRTGNIIKTLRQAGLVLLLVLYGAAALKVDSFHSLFHSQELKELHSPEQESNPCHKSVYHQESQKGCEHKSHITENTKCPLCEYNVTPDQLVENNLAHSHVVVSNTIQFFWFEAVQGSPELSIPARGPPANV